MRGPVPLYYVRGLTVLPPYLCSSVSQRQNDLVPAAPDSGTGGGESMPCSQLIDPSSTQLTGALVATSIVQRIVKARAGRIRMR